MDKYSYFYKFFGKLYNIYKDKKNKTPQNGGILILMGGDPGKTRTCDLRIRNRLGLEEPKISLYGKIGIIFNSVIKVNYQQ